MEAEPRKRPGGCRANDAVHTTSTGAIQVGSCARFPGARSAVNRFRPGSSDGRNNVHAVTPVYVAVPKTIALIEAGSATWRFLASRWRYDVRSLRSAWTRARPSCASCPVAGASRLPDALRRSCASICVDQSAAFVRPVPGRWRFPAARCAATFVRFDLRGPERAFVRLVPGRWRFPASRCRYGVRSLRSAWTGARRSCASCPVAGASRLPDALQRQMAL